MTAIESVERWLAHGAQPTHIVAALQLEADLREVVALAKRAAELEAALRRVVVADERFRRETGLTELDDPIVEQVKTARALLDGVAAPSKRKPRAKGRR